jgi:ribosomal protein S18 acetylase RimI-like enzyme
MMDVLRLDPTAVPRVVAVLHESFHDYPVMRFVLGPDAPEYDERLRTLIHFFVMARVFRDETLLGVPDGEALLGVALVSRPGGPRPPPEFHELRAEVWAELGSDAEARYGAFADACGPFQVDAPHLHLNMIGVRRATQGTGLGRDLLEAVHDLSAADPDSQGVSLTTENPENVALYRHFGYEIVGEATVAPELTTWGFYRKDER